MGKKDLQCLFIGEQPKIYNDLLVSLDSFGLDIHVKRVDSDKVSVSRGLKKLTIASLVFISEKISFSEELLSDLVWQNASDAIVVIISEKNVTTPSKNAFKSNQSSKLYFQTESDNKVSHSTRLHLQYLIDSALNKADLRHCKRLLGISEKRCQWLMDSSIEAIAFVSRDLHLYANTSYLGLFNINSIHELPALSVSDLIVADEYGLFKDFVKNQILRRESNRSLVLSLKKTNGKTFRSRVYAIPSVFKGHKCIQIWVRPLNMYILNEEKKENIKEIDQLKSESEGQNKKVKAFLKTRADKVIKKKNVTPSSLLKGILKRKETSITTQKLVDMKPNEDRYVTLLNHYILSLKVPIAQRVGVDKLLFESGGIDLNVNREIFWDKVKITRLLQILLTKKQTNAILFIRLTEASLFSESFVKWLIAGLNRFENKSPNLTFLFPSELSENNSQQLVHFVEQLRGSNFDIALDNFTVSKTSLSLLKHLRPQYVRLSLSWVKQIEGNKERELALGSFVRQIESKSIKIIAPCDLSSKMRNLFALSGVSFCQEKTSKTV